MKIGSLYGIDTHGNLYCYQHTGYFTGAAVWQYGTIVGTGWGGFTQVFSGSGVIYGITGSGQLLWYRHDGFDTCDGTSTAGAWEGAKVVGGGWGGFKQVFAGADGVIYAIDGSGNLFWYRHDGYLTGAGAYTPGAWEGPKRVGTGWGFNKVFLLSAAPVYGS